MYGVDLPWRAQVGRRLKIGHVGGIVISHEAIIGDDCLIRQNVTIGAAGHDGGSPRIGDRVEIGAGAVIIGNISVGDGALIGPNVVVSTDIPAGARVVAPAPRLFSLAENGSGAGERSPIEPETTEVIMDVVRSVIGTESRIDPDLPLLSSGLIDSLNLVTLVEALESRLGVSIPAEIVDVERFDTPQVIADTLMAERR
jgi:acyl carrier protein